MSLFVAILVGWIVCSFVLGPLALCLVDEDSKLLEDRLDRFRWFRRDGAVPGLPSA